MQGFVALLLDGKLIISFFSFFSTNNIVGIDQKANFMFIYTQFIVIRQTIQAI